MSPRTGRSRACAVGEQSGFALLLVLWLVLIVVLLAAGFDAFVQRRVDNARLLRERVQDRLDEFSTRQTVLFLLATQPFTAAGVTTSPAADTPTGDAAAGLRMTAVGDEIALDGRAWRGFGRVRFALQDQAGLVQLNTDGATDLRWLLDSADTGVAARSALLDALADYRDADGEPRIDGIEAAGYATRGLTPPANTDLRAPAELTRVAGWRQWLAAHPDLPLEYSLAVSGDAALNPNTMPLHLLARLPGMNRASAEEAVALRQREPFRSAADFTARVGASGGIDVSRFRFFPSASLRLRLWVDGSKSVMNEDLELSPLSQYAPWQTKSVYRSARPPAAPTQEAIDEVSRPYFGTGAPAAR